MPKLGYIVPILERIEYKLDLLLANQEKELTNMAALDDAITELQADVTDETTVQGSVLTLLTGLSQQLTAALAAAANSGASAAQLASLAALDASLKTNIGAMTAAVTTNTPTPPASPAPATPATGS